MKQGTLCVSTSECTKVHYHYNSCCACTCHTAGGLWHVMWWWTMHPFEYRYACAIYLNVDTTTVILHCTLLSYANTTRLQQTAEACEDYRMSTCSNSAAFYNFPSSSSSSPSSSVISSVCSTKWSAHGTYQQQAQLLNLLRMHACRCIHYTVEHICM